MKIKSQLLFALFCTLVSSSTFAQENTSRHGYVDSPASRSFMCSSAGGNLNKDCGPVQYEPQSIEGPKGFPSSGPADGKIASAGKAQFSQLDEQSASRWNRVTLKKGVQTFNWSISARHKTDSWKFFITKSDWDQNKPLSRSQFNLTPFCERKDNGATPGDVVTLQCNVPDVPDGYYVILGTWDVADTSNAFYQVIDVDIRS